MKAALVTGATTPVGAAIVAQLLKDQVASPVLAVGAESYEDVKGLFPQPEVIYVQADLTRSRELRTPVSYTHLDVYKRQTLLAVKIGAGWITIES